MVVNTLDIVLVGHAVFFVIVFVVIALLLLFLLIVDVVVVDARKLPCQNLVSNIWGVVVVGKVIFMSKPTYSIRLKDEQIQNQLGLNHVCVILSHRGDTITSVWYFVSMEIYKVSCLRYSITETWYFIHFEYSEFHKN